MGLKAREIAGMAGVSPATVSLILNNKPGVSEETRERVMKIISELGYDTNLLSKPALKNKGSIRFVIYKKHGKVVSDTPFFSALMEGIDQEVRGHGYNLVISYLSEQDGNTADTLRVIEERTFDGILLLATEMAEEDIQLFKRLPVPLVVLDSSFPHEKLDTVIINNREGAWEAVLHLIDRGHAEIGYLQSSVRINNFLERYEGYMRALADSGLKLDRKYTLQLEPTLEGAYQDMQRLLQSQPKLPGAFFADNDIIAFGAVKALKEAGYRIPEDISVIGFDDMPFCEMLEPPLTTMRVFKQRMGMMAVERLLKKIEKGTAEKIKVEVATELVERKSVLTK